MAEIAQTSVATRPLGERLKPWLWTPWTIVVGALLAVAVLDSAQSEAVTLFAIGAFAHTLPYIAFAVGLIAWMKAAGAEAMLARAFKGREVRMIVFAALFGGLAPFCSCEVIPFVAGLLAVGAPLSAVMAFWLSSPLVDPPTLLITAGALGWPFAVGKAAVGSRNRPDGRLCHPCAGRRRHVCRPGSSAHGRRLRLVGPSPFKGTPVWRFWVRAAASHRHSGRNWSPTPCS